VAQSKLGAGALERSAFQESRDRARPAGAVRTVSTVDQYGTLSRIESLDECIQRSPRSEAWGRHAHVVVGDAPTLCETRFASRSPSVSGGLVEHSQIDDGTNAELGDRGLEHIGIELRAPVHLPRNDAVKVITQNRSAHHPERASKQYSKSAKGTCCPAHCAARHGQPSRNERSEARRARTPAISDCLRCSVQPRSFAMLCAIGATEASRVFCVPNAVRKRR